MLSRLLTAVALVFVVWSAQAPSAIACERKCWESDRDNATCRVVCPTNGDAGGGASPVDLLPSGEGQVAVNGPPVCRLGMREVKCKTALGSWSSYASSWCRSAPVQPALDDPIWRGETTGSIYECTRPGFDGLPNPGETVLRWLPAPPEAAAAPDPEDLALRLLASIDFEAPELGMFPRGDSPERMSYVGWRMWLWAESSSSLQWGPVSDSLSQGGVTVSLTARVSGVEWNMGDGKSVSCGKGTPWSEAVTGGRNVASPDCGHVYSEDGRYTVTVTSSWDVEWSGGGRSGSLPFTLSREADVLVGELQSVNRDA